MKREETYMSVVVGMGFSPDIKMESRPYSNRVEIVKTGIFVSFISNHVVHMQMRFVFNCQILFFSIIDRISSFLPTTEAQWGSFDFL